jgi:hypothetical protein
MAKRLNALIPVVRWAVIGLAGAILVLSVIGLFRFPEYAARHPDAFTPNKTWTGAQVQQALNELGWPPMTAAWFLVGQDVFSLVFIYSISAAILWKKSRDWFGLFLMVVFVTLPASSYMLKPVLGDLPGLSFFVDEVMGAIFWQLFFILFFFFPNGRPVPSWTGWFAAGYSIFMLAAIGIKNLGTGPVEILMGSLMVVLSIGSQVYRYFRRSDTVQRQQTKWVVFLLAFFLLLLPVMFLFGFQTPPAESLGPALLKDYGLNFLGRLVFWLTPAVITIAVLRYHLWDIDLIIRRTLLYGALSAVLAGLYYGMVLVLGQIFRALSGQDSPLVVVLSTLVIVFLFTPLRWRIQAAIDRRFYRQSYNAEQAVATFAAAARSETALGALTDQMVSVVEKTVQPEAVWVWMSDKNREV